MNRISFEIATVCEDLRPRHEIGAGVGGRVAMAPEGSIVFPIWKWPCLGSKLLGRGARKTSLKSIVTGWWFGTSISFSHINWDSNHPN